MRQSRMLRNGERVPIDPAVLKVGDYVTLRGVVGADEALTSPGQAVQCVRYIRRKVRVIDQRMGRTTNTQSVHGYGAHTVSSLFGAIVSSMGGLLGGGLSVSRKTERDEWGMETQELSRQEGTARRMTLSGARGSIVLDLSGAEYLELETVQDDFENSQDVGSDGRRTLGYRTTEEDVGSDGRHTLGHRTTEEVLRVGASMIVIGEIGLTDHDGQETLVIRSSMPKNMLDIKTQSVARPFVASPLSESDLLNRIERAGRIYFWCAVPALVTGVALLAVTNRNYESLRYDQIAAASAARAAPSAPARAQRRR
ncbi:hypothetical protein JKP88DRAFT_351469 [Tribonema minus]|uniref:RING-type E3 ubiquitin transferase n=1 Tax=Tribonema minus TaxID=303371 RepID=A0A836C8K9_9STRA|nr:hypothetical protein JKP88DRAFT_351469 [Tribonema minus]